MSLCKLRTGAYGLTPKSARNLSQESYSPGESIDKDLIDITFDREKIKKGSPETIAEFAEYLLPRA